MTKSEIVSVITAILSFGLILFVGLKTNILRAGGNGSPYSFHKFQIWLWSLIICPCFALNWGYINPTKPMINETALILLGISLGTVLTAEVITSVQKNDPKRPALFKALSANTSSFWSDILTDDNQQVSPARLQQLLFTLTYVAIYLSMFFPLMNYPEFDKTAFILMGISTGTFLIGKGLYK